MVMTLFEPPSNEKNYCSLRLGLCESNPKTWRDLTWLLLAKLLSLFRRGDTGVWVRERLGKIVYWLNTNYSQKAT